jgi:hypothetical protein
MPCAVATVVVARGMLGASGPKSVVGALGSKIIGGTSSSKPAVVQKKTFAPVKKRCVPMIGAMEGASLEESWVSLPHGQTTGGSTRPTALRPEP